ncbi:MAG: dialkylresorcinol condensing enzyme DarA [Desulfobacteraceae bacterium]|nr:MAG: dialkylresorcinol condensing enzyme DarA [Desulfobacteraceae bacterium]
MKKLLVVYYSQTGQLTRIVHSVLKPIADSGQVEVVIEELQPQEPYPFPWSAIAFADAFPESFQQRPCRLKPFRFDPNAHYDAVLLAYQVWYLSPSIPVTAFLTSAEAARVMRNRPVTTLIGCRNMWLQAHEKVKEHIVTLGGRPAGNIVLMDRAPNLLGVISIAAWMLTGRKERYLKIFPKPGIADEDIETADRFGEILVPAIDSGDWSSVQSELNRRGAVRVVPAYILFEQRISKIFNIWAKFIDSKGGPGDPARRTRLRAFIAYLLAAVFLIAPVATVVTSVLQRLKRKKINQMVSYFAENRYRGKT